MKHLLLLTICSFLIVFSHAQEKGFEVKKNAKGLYIEHTVAAKEGLFSIGRLYNVHPKHLASFNDWDYDKGLSIGQVLNIPLTDTNFKHNPTIGAPVYHTVVSGDGLFKIGQSYGVPVDEVKGLNRLKNNNISPGQKLIMGFLFSSDLTGIAREDNPKETEKKQPEEKKNEPIKNDIARVKEEKPVVKEEENPVKNVALVETVKTNQKPATMGYFQVYFDKQVKQYPATNEKTATAGIFKTVSGWQDGKYYMLIDNVQPGTIVKISNPENGKVVFAKVLGAMEGINLNKGLDIRISNAASSVLEIPEANADKFIVQLNY